MAKNKQAYEVQQRNKVLATLENDLRHTFDRSGENLQWLRENLHPYFFLTMKEDRGALVNLASRLHDLKPGSRIVLSDGEDRLILATLSEPGSYYESLRIYGERAFSYAELTHSFRTVGETGRLVEIQRFEYDGGSAPALDRSSRRLSGSRRAEIGRVLRASYPGYDHRRFDEDLDLVCANDPRYVRISPPERTARLLWLYRQGQRFDGLFFDSEEAEDVLKCGETRLLFAVGNPPERYFLTQVMEVFRRLRIGVQRAYSIRMRTSVSPWFLGTFYVRTEDGQLLDKNSELYATLKAELYNTQILSTTSEPYRRSVSTGTQSGQEASLTNALIAFCYTNLAHSRPDRYNLVEIVNAFMANPAFLRDACLLFKARFDPDLKRRRSAVEEARRKVDASVRSYNTGHRHLDGVRREVYRTAATFINYILKTNFYVPEKHALAFRLDPAYLEELGENFTVDLPEGTPFRITFFSGRHGAGYHVGFTDIARGGWRTIICRGPDDYNETLETLFREVYILAHTQHLKNKDIYEGGSKMVVALDASDVDGEEERTQRLYKLQFGFINAFLDLFALQDGCNCHPRVVDYYGEQEAIELGPDENLHDSMVELIARQAVKRKYILGNGIISSKHVGINHKQHGVTSLGVYTFARIAMKEVGVDIEKDAFSVKMTGGPAGDVAGNFIRLLLANCRRANITLIVDGSGVLFDPHGLDKRELGRLVLRKDIEHFNPARLHEGGFMLMRRVTRTRGMRETFLRIRREEKDTVETWVMADDMHREFREIIFREKADLFIPAGGRPETVDGENWVEFLDPAGVPSCRVIVEGANSFFATEARNGLQEKGVVIIRDASANKCGVIASSYEIIANLLMREDEFFVYKERYIRDVLTILEKRAAHEAQLIFRRRSGGEGGVPFTAISENLSREINDLYDRIFDLLTKHPDVLRRRAHRRALFSHLPEVISRVDKLRRRVGGLPLKYRCAMVACEVAGRIVYDGGWKRDFEETLHDYIRKTF